LKSIETFLQLPEQHRFGYPPGPPHSSAPSSVKPPEQLSSMLLHFS